jgi:hypothetical protein
VTTPNAAPPRANSRKRSSGASSATSPARSSRSSPRHSHQHKPSPWQLDNQSPMRSSTGSWRPAPFLISTYTVPDASLSLLLRPTLRNCWQRRQQHDQDTRCDSRPRRFKG